MENKRTTGSVYEKQAKEYLEQKGYTILETNYFCLFGEIDLIAKDRECLVFVEVKFKSNTKYGYPTEMVTRKKMVTISKCARFYVIKKGWDAKECRFDVIGILEDKIEHTIDAFGYQA